MNNYIIEINLDNSQCTCVDGHQINLDTIDIPFDSYADFKSFNYLTNQILPDNQFGNVWYTNHLNDHSIKINYIPSSTVKQIHSEYNHNHQNPFSKIRLWYCPSNPVSKIRIIVQYHNKWYWFEDSEFKHMLLI